MSVFENMASLLEEINIKLGSNAGEEAVQAFDKPIISDKEETKFDYGQIVKSFSEALNNVPVFNKLSDALVQFSAKKEIKEGKEEVKEQSKEETKFDYGQIVKSFSEALNNVPVFNKLSDALTEFSTKNNEKKEGVLKEEKVKEDKEGKDQLYNKNTSDIVNGFKQALNSVPIFNKIHTALAGLKPFMDMLRGFAASKIVNSFTSKMSPFIKSQWTDFPPALKEKFLKENPENKTKTDNLKRYSGIKGFKEGMDYFSKQFKILTYNFVRSFKGLGTPYKDFWKSLSKPAISKTPFKDLFGNIRKSITGGIGNLGAGMGGIGAAGGALMGMLKLPLLLATVAGGLLKLAKSISDSQRAIAQYSGQMSAAFAISDLRKMLRDMKIANATAPATAKFLKAWNDMMDAFAPTLIKIINGILEFGTELAKAATPFLKAIGEMTAGILEFVNSLPKKIREIDDAARAKLKAKENEFSSAFSGTEQAIQEGDEDKYNEQMDVLKKQKKYYEDELWSVKYNPFHVPDVGIMPTLLSPGTATKNAELGIKQADLAIEKLKNEWLNPQPKEKSLQPKTEADKVSTDKKKAEEDKKKLEEEKDKNAYKQTLDKIKEAAKAAIDFYTKDNVMGAGEFMLGAATWNYDPDKKRASESNAGLWTEAAALKRHGK